MSELGAPELADDPRFRRNRDRLTTAPALTVKLDRAAHGPGWRGPLPDGCSPLACRPVRSATSPRSGPTPTPATAAWPLEQDGYRSWGLPIKLSRTPGGVARTPPRFGAHGREILEQLSFAAAEIEGLIAAGVVLDQRRR